MLGCHRAHPGLPHLRDLRDHAGRQQQFLPRQLRVGGFAALGQGQHIQKAKGNAATNFQFAALHHTLQTDNRVGDASALGGLCGVCCMLGQQGLQRRAVDQGQAHRVIARQRLRQ